MQATLTLEDIYVTEEMRSKLFTGTTPVDLELWRFVRADEQIPFGLYPGLREKTIGKPPRQRTRKPDLQIERGPDGKLWAKMNTGGVSTFGGEFSMRSAGAYFVIPRGTRLPFGLAVTEDEFSEYAGRMHYTIAPFQDMPLIQYLRLLSQLSKSLVKVK
jgi:Tse2 ADP-ribosyltransferase toxins